MPECIVCGEWKEDSAFEYRNRQLKTRREVCRMCEERPQNGWEYIDGEDERRVRLRLVKAQTGDLFMVGAPSGMWRVSRTPYRFEAWLPTGEKYSPNHHRASSVRSDYAIRRTVAAIIAAIYGDNASPELKFRNVVKVGNRYAAYSFSKLEIVGYADTPDEAYELSVGWKQADRIIARPVKKQGRKSIRISRRGVKKPAPKVA